MSRHPLTVYLEREQLVAVEKLARAACIPKSAWAGQVLDRALSGQGASPDRVFEQIIKIRATLDALVATQPHKEELRKRIDVKLQRYTAEAQGSLALSPRLFNSESSCQWPCAIASRRFACAATSQ
jgi:hypothetical protein